MAVTMIEKRIKREWDDLVKRNLTPAYVILSFANWLSLSGDDHITEYDGIPIVITMHKDHVEVVADVSEIAEQIGV